MTTTYSPGLPSRRRPRCGDRAAATNRRQPPTSLPTPPLRDVLAAEGWTVALLAARAGLHPKSVARALGRPRLGVYLADALAVACGRHPGEIWAEWFGWG